MPHEIDLDHLSDRDLLVMNVQTTNSLIEKVNIINGSIADHEKRLTKSETCMNIITFIFGPVVTAGLIALGTKLANLW